MHGKLFSLPALTHSVFRSNADFLPHLKELALNLLHASEKHFGDRALSHCILQGEGNASRLDMQHDRRFFRLTMGISKTSKEHVTAVITCLKLTEIN